MSGKFVLDNGLIRAEVSPRGGELCAVYKDGCNYIWNGDPLYWDKHALNLFPYIARLTDETYTINGESYRMDIHGFLKDRMLSPESHTDESVAFVLESDAETLAQYPFDFLYRVQYDIAGTALGITYTVENRSGYTMYFGIGGHPGFNLPLEHDLTFEDYYLEFDDQCWPDRIVCSKRNFVSGYAPYSIKKNIYIPLTHDLFDDDAVILKNMSKAVCLKSNKGTRGVTVEYPGFQYLGIWHTPRTKAPFICIEPWSSLPSRDGVVEEFTNQRDLISLAEGEIYKNAWRITFN